VDGVHGKRTDRISDLLWIVNGDHKDRPNSILIPGRGSGRYLITPLIVQPYSLADGLIIVAVVLGLTAPLNALLTLPPSERLTSQRKASNRLVKPIGVDRLSRGERNSEEDFDVDGEGEKTRDALAEGLTCCPCEEVGDERVLALGVSASEIGIGE